MITPARHLSRARFEWFTTARLLRISPLPVPFVLQTRIDAVAVLFAAVIAFLLMRSQQFDLNGVTEAIAVEHGGAELLTANHLLYRPVAAVVYSLSQHFGYTGNAIAPLQVLTGVCGVIAITLLYSLYSRLAHSKIAALIATALVALSWAFWTYSTDISYIVPAAACVAGTCVLICRDRPGTWSMVGIGVLWGLAIGTWEANLFATPAAALAIAVRTTGGVRPRIVRVTAFAAASAATVAGAFVGFATQAGFGSVSGIFKWLTTYGGVRLPIWGHWGWDRIPPALGSFIASLLPVWNGLGLRAFTHGSLSPDKILSLSSLLAVVALLLSGIAFTLKTCSKDRASLQTCTWLAVGFVSYLPFIIWWDPFEPKWFVVPDMLLVGIAAVSWGSNLGRLRWWTIGLAASVAIISAANFAAAIWPRHSEIGNARELSDCVSTHMGSDDLLLATDWSWAGYLSYLDGARVVPLVGMTQRATGDPITTIDGQLRETASDGGHTYMQSAASYDADYDAWFQAQNGYSLADLQQFQLGPAFTCSKVQFDELASR